MKCSDDFVLTFLCQFLDSPNLTKIERETSAPLRLILHLDEFTKVAFVNNKAADLSSVTLGHLLRLLCNAFEFGFEKSDSTHMTRSLYPVVYGSSEPAAFHPESSSDHSLLPEVCPGSNPNMDRHLARVWIRVLSRQHICRSGPRQRRPAHASNAGTILASVTSRSVRLAARPSCGKFSAR